MKRSLLIALLLLLAPACRTRSPLKSMHEASMDEVSGKGLYAGLDPEHEERQRGRLQRTRAIVEAGELERAEDYLYAGLLLVSSSEPADLRTAEELGREASERGDGRGLRVAAEAVDKLLLLPGRPQKYGTQSLWSPVRGVFELGLVDPFTTDDERRDMGVPSLEEIRQRVEMLNSMSTAEMARSWTAQ